MSEKTAEKKSLVARLEEEGDVAADYLEALLDIADLDGDIDIDVESARRHDIYRAIFKRYGSERVTLLSMQSTYRGRGAMRDSGLALGLDDEQIDEIAKKRNFAYYQLGVIYKEKFKEYQLASKKLEQLLTYNPEEKFVLPSMYNLYKIYQITDNAKAEEMKARISSQYPNSRYAQIINNANPNSVSSKEDRKSVV